MSFPARNISVYYNISEISNVHINRIQIEKFLYVLRIITCVVENSGKIHKQAVEEGDFEENSSFQNILEKYKQCRENKTTAYIKDNQTCYRIDKCNKIN